MQPGTWACSDLWLRASNGMGTATHLVRGLCVAVDVHYLSSGAARTAAAVPPMPHPTTHDRRHRDGARRRVNRPGESYRRQLPPLRGPARHR